jgi:hypothetical protein
MTSKPCEASFARHAGRGHGSDRCCTRRMHPHEIAPYKAIVQSVLLYGSKKWVLSTASLARLEGFHLRAAYRMSKKHVPRRGPRQQWVYPPSDMVLEECGMHTIEHYIGVQRETIAKYVIDRSILVECQGAHQRRGSMPRRWWWEQKMCLDKD